MCRSACFFKKGALPGLWQRCRESAPRTEAGRDLTDTPPSRPRVAQLARSPLTDPVLATAGKAAPWSPSAGNKDTAQEPRGQGLSRQQAVSVDEGQERRARGSRRSVWTRGQEWRGRGSRRSVWMRVRSRGAEAIGGQCERGPRSGGAAPSTTERAAPYRSVRQRPDPVRAVGRH